MYAEMSPDWVSTTGMAVSEPPPRASESLAARLEEAGVQVEHVAGVGLAAWRAAQQSEICR
jgi:hypothetical protein